MSTGSNYVTPAPLETRLALHRRFSVNPEGWHRWVLRRLDIRPGSRVLERVREQVPEGTRCAFGTNGRHNLSKLKRFLPVVRDGASISDLNDSFTLESGYVRVRHVFGDARVVRYADALSVTDADALAAYVASLPLGPTAERLRAMRDAVALHIDRHGALYLNKDAGLIES